jgi:predicted RNA-binding protein associated with RNAse of E/G family
MKTNLKNGLFIYGFIPVDTGQIKISDNITDATPVIFETGVDGLYAILAKTDDEGTVQELLIDVGEHTRFIKNPPVIEIDDDAILLKNGEEFIPEEENAD